MRYSLIVVFIASLCFSGLLANTINEKQSYPFVILTNGLLNVKVLLPDAQNGYCYISFNYQQKSKSINEPESCMVEDFYKKNL